MKCELKQEQLLRERKLVLVLDLDETLVHSTVHEVPPNVQIKYRIL